MKIINPENCLFGNCDDLISSVITIALMADLHLSDTDSGTDSDLDSEAYGYIVLCRTCTDLDLHSDPDPDPQLLLHSFLGWISTPGLGFRSMSSNVTRK